MCKWILLRVYMCVYVHGCCVHVRICVCEFMGACGYVCVCARMCICIYIFACMLFFHPVVIELKSNSKRKVSFKAFIFLGSQLALISFLGLKSISSILRCCIMPTKTKLPIIWKHCLYTARKSSFLVGIFPHSD